MRAKAQNRRVRLSNIDKQDRESVIRRQKRWERLLRGRSSWVGRGGLRAAWLRLRGGIFAFGR
ncbi:hypothetical protein SDC9_163490 [bioreactor metagenome]|uniref:Uncharacterized protein n=1 Tax=bioreactor metagenome TaxID=1076179 RepID=A0A645FRA8_9ZZZZ